MIGIRFLPNSFGGDEEIDLLGNTQTGMSLQRMYGQALEQDDFISDSLFNDLSCFARILEIEMCQTVASYIYQYIHHRVTNILLMGFYCRA